LPSNGALIIKVLLLPEGKITVESLFRRKVLEWFTLAPDHHTKLEEAPL
jgi:hypothetical protein